MPPKKKKSGGEGGAPAWMVTYADMVTLLLTFFVLLLSMANMDISKVRDALGSLRGAFGIFGTSARTEIDKPKIVSFTPVDDDYVQRLYNKINVIMSRMKIDEDIKLVKDRGAVILQVKDSILFDPGSRQLKSTAYPVLRKIAGLVRPLPLALRIEGHTDNLSSGDPAMTNWDLSIQRAVAVLKFLVDEKLIPLERLAAVGYGDQHPVAPNNTEEGRTLNRRVEFVLESLNHYRDDLPYLIDARDQMPF
ncbi:MAG: flagellar motor protein MotB [Syntrophotaleaceae bacterium]